MFADHIVCALGENKICVLLLLDLSAFFDTVDNEILLARLESFFGIRSTVLSWFHSYLSERKQFVMVQDNRSSTAPLDFRILQGSVLGLVLFCAGFQSIRPCSVYESVGEILKFTFAAIHKVNVVGES